jgi:glycosyltransferase involved in cell wall biosynthesis
MTEEPLVSVIMNCFNGEKYLRQAIDSVFAQSYRNWEIIFWDNQSTDRSAEIFRSYHDERLKYYYAPTHTLLHEARNYAFAKANGQFISILDVDDVWLPEKLVKQIPLFDDPQVGIVCGNFWYESARRHKRWKLFRHNAPTGRVTNELLTNYFVGSLTLVVRRSAIEALAVLFDPRLHIIGEFDLVVRLSIHWNLDCVNEPIAVYRLHDESETVKNPERHLRETEVWAEEMKNSTTIGTLPAFPRFKSQAAYMRAKFCIFDGDRRGAIRLLRGLPWDCRKLKLWMALLLPNRFLRRFSG